MRTDNFLMVDRQEFIYEFVGLKEKPMEMSLLKIYNFSLRPGRPNECENRFDFIQN